MSKYKDFCEFATADPKGFVVAMKGTGSEDLITKEDLVYAIGLLFIAGGITIPREEAVEWSEKTLERLKVQI